MKNEILKPAPQQHIWEVWLGENQEIRGRLIAEWRASQLPGLYEYNYKIEGRNNIYFIASHDAISRDQAIWFAQQEYKGALRRINLDVSANRR